MNEELFMKWKEWIVAAAKFTKALLQLYKENGFYYKFDNPCQCKIARSF